MEKTETRYYCDICKKEIKADELRHVWVIGRDYDCEGKSYTVSNLKTDMCPGCVDKYFKTTCKHFATVSSCFGSIESVLPQEEEND